MKIKDYLNKNYDISLIALSYLLDLPKSRILLDYERILDDDLINKLESILKKVEEGYPLQYAIGYWQFLNLKLKVDERALIPRFETEIIVDYIIKSSFKKDTILDIGTGSGAIALSLGSNLNNSKILGVDISKDAISLARENKDLTKVNNVDFAYSDLFSNVVDKFDLIISNPPYISIDEYNNLDKKLFFEPRNALVGPDGGIYFYKQIIKDAKDYLNDGGRLIFEIGYDQKKRVFDLLYESDFKNIRAIKDFNDYDRFIIAEKG